MSISLRLFKFSPALLITFIFFSLSQAEENYFYLKLEQDQNIPGGISVYAPDLQQNIYYSKEPFMNLSDVKFAEYEVQNRNELPLWMQKIPESETLPTIYISIYLTEIGKKKFAKITNNNVGKRVGIFLNNKLLRSPKIFEPINSGTITIITSSEDEAKEITREISNLTRHST